jgi:WXG100 family type VII secretion target
VAADIIQSDYDQLEAIATRFRGQAARTDAVQEHLKRRVEALQGGGWQGQGAVAFYGEMDAQIFPAMVRLARALEEAQSTTLKIAQIIRTAEQEAAQPFRGNGSGGDGGLSPNGGSSPASPAQTGRGFWEHVGFQGKGDIWEFDYLKKEGKFAPGVDLKWGVKDAVWGDPDAEGWSLVGGEGGLKTGFGEKGFSLGAYGEYYTAQGKVDGVWGDKNLGLTGGLSGKALSADGFIGIKDNSLGASIGGSLVSAEGEVGTNVAGVNVGVSGEIGLKAELGFQIGQKNELKLPFVTLGFSFGKAKED